MTHIRSKIARVLVALAFGMMVLTVMGPSANVDVLGGQCTAAAFDVHDKQPHPDSSHPGPCCTDMHCCPLMPSVLSADTSLQPGDIVFSALTAASPLLLIRPIDPPPKTLPA